MGREAIWRGAEYNQRGEEQLADYLDAYHLKRGYMVSFNFNHRRVQFPDACIVTNLP